MTPIRELQQIANAHLSTTLQDEVDRPRVADLTNIRGKLIGSAQARKLQTDPSDRK